MSFDASRAARKERPAKSISNGLVLFFLDQVLDLFLVPNLSWLWLLLEIDFIGNQHSNCCYKDSKDLNNTRDTTLPLLQVQYRVWKRCLWNIIPFLYDRFRIIKSSTDIHYKNYNFLSFFSLKNRQLQDSNLCRQAHLISSQTP